LIEFEHFHLIWLAPLPLLVMALPFVYRSRRSALRVPFLDRLKQASGARETHGHAYSRATPMPLAVALAVWSLVLLALMKPEYIGKPIIETVAERELIIAVDLSHSMTTRDVTTLSGAETSRLDAVKQVLKRFLAARDGEKIALIVFGTMAFVQAPFSTDLKTLDALLEQARVGMAGPKTAIGDAIGLSIKLFDKSKINERLLVLLTDGADTASRIPPMKAAGMALDQGIEIITIGFGNPKGAGDNPVDIKLLKAIARHTKGRFYDARDTATLKGVIDEIDKLKPKKVKRLSYRPSTDLFVYPVALAFIILILSALVLVHRQRHLGDAQGHADSAGAGDHGGESEAPS